MVVIIACVSVNGRFFTTKYGGYVVFTKLMLPPTLASVVTNSHSDKAEE